MAILVCLRCGDLRELLGDAPKASELEACECGGALEPDDANGDRLAEYSAASAQAQGG